MMSNSEINSNDEITVDADDQWDDFIDEDSSFEDQTADLSTDSKPSIQLDKIIKLLLLVLILCGGVYTAISFFGNTSKDNIAVVKIDNAQSFDNSSPDQEIEVNEDNNLTLNHNSLENTENNITNDNHQDKAIDGEVIDSTNSTISVLTPMPDNFTDDIVLSSLESNNMDDKASLEIENNQEILLEDKLLPKTEVVFEENPKNLNIETSPITVDKTEVDTLAEVITQDNKPVKLEALESKASVSEKVIAPPTIVKPEIKAIKKTSVNQSKKIVKKNNWVIRAAQQGSAVIYNKISGEMKTIEVNNFVSGIGRVKSIKKINGKWHIVGSSGVIK